jgi:hypothetical protein
VRSADISCPFDSRHGQIYLISVAYRRSGAYPAPYSVPVAESKAVEAGL